AGQGIIYEQAQFAQVAHYTNLGTLHLIDNNQIGYTVESGFRDGPLEYCSNVMRSIDCPVIHVNGAYPEQVARACQFAIDYRAKYKKDVLIDLICFRRHGHNELDHPTFTNPLLYERI